jgi:hypothetical protein
VELAAISGDRARLERDVERLARIVLDLLT